MTRKRAELWERPAGAKPHGSRRIPTPRENPRTKKQERSGGPRDYFELQYESQLNSLADKLEDLRYQAETTFPVPGTEFLRDVAELRRQLAAAVKKLAQLKAASVLAWPHIKRELEEIVFNLATAIGNTAIEHLPFKVENSPTDH
jgi:hypothetical protein